MSETTVRADPVRADQVRFRSAETSRRRWERSLHLGFAAACAAALASGLLLAYLASRIQGEVHELVWRADRSTVLLARIGRDTARLQSLVSQNAVGGSSPRLALHARIEADMAELEPLLCDQELSVWSGVRPKLLALRSDLGRSRHGTFSPQVAHDIQHRIDGVIVLLAWLGEMNEAESRTLLAAADEHLRWLRACQLGLAGGLLAVLWLIWLATIRHNRRLRERVIGALDRYARINRDLDAFAGRLAHDVKNMFTPLLGLESVLAEGDPALTATVGAELRLLGERGLNLMNGLLEFSRAGAPPGEQAASSVPACLEGVLAGLRAETDRLEVQVEVEVKDVWVAVAPGLLDSLLANLIGNAAKFVGGREERRVMVSAQAEPPWCVLEVADTGPGVPEREQTRLFEPFYRVPGTGEPGAGLGLATAARIVEAHGGTIELCAETTQGTCFVVRLPLGSPPAA